MARNVCSMHLEIDAHPNIAGWRGYIGPGLAIFARPSVTYQDVMNRRLAESFSAQRLFSAFVDAAAMRLERLSHSVSLEEFKSLVIAASREAFSRFPEACEAGIGMMEFMLVSNAERNGQLTLAHIGAGVALRIAAGKVSLVVEPHSPHYGPEAVKVSEGDYALVSTAILEPSFDFVHQINVAEVELHSGEWLVLAPGSSAAATGLSLEALPISISGIERDVIRQLAAPYGAYPKSWLAISARAVE